MNLCSTNHYYSIKLEGACDGCRFMEEKEEAYVWDEIVPGKLCPFAYYSIIPYWVSFVQSAWFRWRESKNDVNCQCPRPDGVVFLVRKVPADGKQIIEAEVTKVGDPSCPYNHVVGAVFRIEPTLCPALFPSLWTQLGQDKAIDKKTQVVRCCIAPASLHMSTV